MLQSANQATLVKPWFSKFFTRYSPLEIAMARQDESDTPPKHNKKCDKDFTVQIGHLSDIRSVT